MGGVGILPATEGGGILPATETAETAIPRIDLYAPCLGDAVVHLTRPHSPPLAPYPIPFKQRVLYRVVPHPRFNLEPTL